MDFIQNIPEFKKLIDEADHVDVKTFEGRVSHREFISSMLSYYPWWVLFLYKIRAMVVRILGLKKHEKPDQPYGFPSQDLSFTPGDNATFFIVHSGEENRYWLAETPEDKHLIAYIGVVQEPQANNVNRFHVITIVKYIHWTGNVYFNLIRPFHHLVVNRMGKAGLGKP